MYSAIRDMTSYSQLFDFIILNNNEVKPVSMTEEGGKILNQAYANLQLWNKGLVCLVSWLEEVNEEGASLVTFIQKEYQLKTITVK
jgi:hypothetical protein